MRPLLLRAGGAVIAGALLALAYGLAPQAWAAWLAAAILLAVCGGASRRMAFACGASAGAFSSLSLMAYMIDLGGPADAAAIALARALAWGLVAVASTWARTALPAPLALFVAPAWLAGLETAQTALSPHGAAGSLAYSQMDALPVIQAAAWGGGPAITFLVILGGAIAAEAFVRGRAAFSAVLAPALMIAASLGAGAWRLAQPAEQGPTLALIATDRFDGAPTAWRDVWAAYEPAIAAAARDGARIVVLPEKIATLSQAETPAARAAFVAAARAHDVDLLVGVAVETDAGLVNRAYLIANSGEAHLYDKRRLVPGWEADFTAGAGSLVTPVAGAQIGAAICKDMDFPALARDYANRGVALMLVPAWDFGADAWLHARMAVLRGVEGGYAVARSARDGMLTVSDAFGRVVAEARTGASMTILSAPAPANARRPAFYALVGDLFGWACLLFAGLALIAARFVRKS